MLPDKIKSEWSFTVMEMIISIAIIAAVSGSLVAMTGPFNQRQQLAQSALRLVGDLRLAQQFSRTLKDQYRYYGVRFFSGLGPDADRAGYKIIRYNPMGLSGTPPPPVNPLDFGIIKSSDEADIPLGAEFIENTFFAERVQIDPTSDFQPDVTTDDIVFTPEGAATTDGQLSTVLQLGVNDEIILSMGQNQVKIKITGLTGYARIE